jgi:hypothetical protein
VVPERQVHQRLGRVPLEKKISSPNLHLRRWSSRRGSKLSKNIWNLKLFRQCRTKGGSRRLNKSKTEHYCSKTVTYSLVILIPGGNYGVCWY